jgi:transposase
MKTPFRLKDGTERTSQSVLLRQAWKENGKVRHHTVASLSKLPAAEIDALEAVLNHGHRAAGRVESARGRDGLAHGAVAAVWAMAQKIGLPEILGEARPERDLALALVIARLVRPASKNATLAWLPDTTLGQDLGLARATTDDAYRAMDWLGARQDAIEAALAEKHLSDAGTNPRKMALFDLSSTWVEGSRNELARFGYSRDKKKHRRQVEFALVAAPDGAPVAVRAFAGNTSDPASFTTAIETVADKFGVEDAVMVGDRGMITDTKIAELRKHPGLGWLTALKHSQIADLAQDRATSFQPSLLDEWGLAEFTSDMFPGERLVACLNPDVADRSRAKRDRLVQASLDAAQPVLNQVAAGRLKDPGVIGRRIGKLVGKYKVEKYLLVDVGPGRASIGRDNERIRQAEALDGIYVVRTSATAEELDAAETVRCYKNLSRVEQDFASIKGDDVQVRPIWHWKASRVEAHLLVCMLASHLAWHLRRTWAPLTYADTEPKDPGRDPVKAQHRSKTATVKASTRRTPHGGTPRTFRGLLDHLALLQRVTIDVATDTATHTFTSVNQPDADQAEAFRLIGAPIPETLTGRPKPVRRTTRLPETPLPLEPPNQQTP